MRLHVKSWSFGGNQFSGGGLNGGGRGALRLGVFLLLLSAAAFTFPKFFAYLFAFFTGLFGLGITITALSLWRRRGKRGSTPQTPEEGTWEEVR